MFTFQSTYYMEGDTGHRVFQTQFGKHDPIRQICLFNEKSLEATESIY